VDKLSKGESNFENVLASQNCVFGKAGLGFNPQNKQDKFSKSFSKMPEKQPIGPSKQSIVTCFYYMKRGHSVWFCKIRKYVVPRGFMKWIPKCNKDSIDECKQKWTHIHKGTKSLYLKIFFVGNLGGEQATMVLGQWMLQAHDRGQIKVLEHLL